MSILKRGDVALAVGVLAIVMMLFVPMPAMILDVLFAASISVAVIILLTVIFVDKALEFSAFPMLLLVTTLLRLSLNVSSTRLILSEGHQSPAAAGKIIETFGEVVTGGNFVVGIIIFLILVIVNFVVITKGATRIAEVAARFTLDSLPGKQMAIDADLNAGLITETDARNRRLELEQETGFFGAMDGASKFVRGDAVAGLIITGLNIAVGMIVGMVTYDMGAGEAAERYVILTVGDGLVAQIPALVISIAAGILVAKSGTVDAAGTVIFKQLGSNPRAMYIAAGLLFIISLIPNMPLAPFWLLAIALSGMGYFITVNEEKMAAQVIAEQEAEELAEEEAPAEEPISSILHIDTLRLELGYGLLSLIDESKGGKLTEQIKAMRRQMAKEIGFVVPSIRIQDNMQLESGGYSVSIKDISAGHGVLKPGHLLAMDPTGTAPPIEGEDTVEPTFGLPAKWIQEGKKEEASFNGYTVVDCSTVITTHLTEAIRENMSELLTRKETEKLIDEVKLENEKLIEELIPAKISMGSLQKILQNLLQERVSIRDLPTILEALADSAEYSKNISELTESVRTRLARQLCTQHAADDGIISVVALSGAWEKEFSNSLHASGDSRQLAMEPAKVQSFIQTTHDAFEKHMMAGLQPVLLTSAQNRPFVRSILERTMPSIAILAQTEIYPKAKIKTVGTL